MIIIIVFDTNVYLDFYKYTYETIKEIVNYLENSDIFDELFITETIYNEFLSNYQEKKGQNKKIAQNFLANFGKRTRELKEGIKKLKHQFFEAINSKANLRIEELSSLFNKKVADIEQEIFSSIDNIEFSIDDKKEDIVLELVKKIYDISKPKKFNELEKLEFSIEAEQRIKLKFAPGFTDAEKTNSKDKFARYNDFIIWKEILDEVKKNKSKLIIIQNEKKIDWWSDEKRQFPAEILTLEYNKVCGLNLQPGFFGSLCMYNFSDFVRFYEWNISSKAIGEIQGIARYVNGDIEESELEKIVQEITDMLPNNDYFYELINDKLLEENSGNGNLYEINLDDLDINIGDFNKVFVKYDNTTNKVIIKINIEIDGSVSGMVEISMHYNATEYIDFKGLLNITFTTDIYNDGVDLSLIDYSIEEMDFKIIKCNNEVQWDEDPTFEKY